VSGVCFGFEVDSELPFRFTRPGRGDRLEVVARDEDVPEPTGAPLVEWQANHERPSARVHRTPDGYGLWIDGGVGCFELDLACRAIRVPGHDDPIRREERLWSIPALLAYLDRGDHSVHAAVVEIDGGAVLLGAPGRFGKTTLAASFLARGFRVLSEDLACCRFGGEPTLLPGPAVLRVRRDVHERLSFPRTSAVLADANRVHLEMDHESRGSGDALPISAVVLLRDGGDRFVTERVATAAALPDLWTLSFQLPGPDARRRCFAAVTSLASSVPVWNFARPITFESIDESIERLVDTVTS
jgi:hypothetical protein